MARYGVAALVLIALSPTGVFAAPGRAAGADTSLPAADSNTTDVARPVAAAAAPVSAAASAEPTAAAVGVSPSEAPSSTRLGDVTVTGTAIPRTDAATALPVTILKTQQLREEGITSTPQLLEQITSSSSNFSAGYSTGITATAGNSYANLRGLGISKTLILLNGRRLANNAYNGGAVDLSAIPFAAIERVEVLRSGASALYGTDAIGGVINFITEKNLQGGDVNLQYTMPTRDGGGNSADLSATFGKGDLAKDGWNVMGTLSHQHQDSISMRSRDFITPLDPRVNDVTSRTDPANYFQGATGVFANPYAADGCDVKQGLVNTLTPSGQCAENYALLGPEIQQKRDENAFFGRGALAVGEHQTLSLSYLWTRDQVYYRLAPGNANDATVSPDSPYFPGNGITPASSDPDFDAGEPLDLYWKTVGLGPRNDRNVNQNHRVVLDFEGRLAGFHYDTALSFNQSSTTVDLVNGTSNPALLTQAIEAGVLNPFAIDQSAAGQAALRNAEVFGNIESAKGHVYTWDGKINHEIGDWFGAGAAAIAVGAQYRHEQLSDRIDGDTAAQLSDYDVYHIDENRDVEGIWSELNVPIFSQLSLDAAARYDNYSDVGDTINPKVSLRYQPLQALVLRASYSEGFHAPTLYDLYGPQTTGSSPTLLNDPVLCPGGTPAAGGSAGRDCKFEFQELTGGNPDLQSEKSKQWDFGFVLQLGQHVSAALDFWAVELKNQISNTSGSYLVDNYDRFEDRFNRGPNGHIDYITNLTANLGKTETNGEDVQLDAAWPTTTGTYALSLNGTYVNKYDYQQAPGADYIDKVDNYSNGVIFRWKQKVTLSWSKGPWALRVINHFKTGYRDMYPDRNARVNPYVTWDTSGTYRFDNGLSLTLGSNNVFDHDPPFSDQFDLATPGYDARYADGVGRTAYARLDYRF